MLSNFEHLLPEVVFEAVETLGGRCTGRSLALNAMENRVYDVEMEEGNNRIIKFYRPGRWDRETILSEHRFLETADTNEIPVVKPLLDSSGNSLFCTKEILFSIFPKKPGRLEPELNKEQLKRLGRYLGRLHNAGESLKGVKRMRLDPKNYGLASLQGIKSEGVIQGNLGRIFETIVTEAVKLMEPLFKEVKFVLTHGDCHAGNVLWNKDEPYFIDFDDMLFAPAIQDIWMLIGGSDDYAMKNCDMVLNAYTEVRVFDEGELDLIESLRMLRMIYFNYWIARRREDGAFKLAFPHFGTERYWQEQNENLSLQLEKIRALGVSKANP